MEQIGDVPVPQTQEQIAKGVIVIPQEHLSWCSSSEIYPKREYHSAWSKESPRQTRVRFAADMKCLAEKSIDGSSCGIGVNVEPYCQRSGKTSGGAHAESAGAGPNGSGQSLRGVSHRGCWQQLLGFWTNIAPEVQKERWH